MYIRAINRSAMVSYLSRMAIITLENVSMVQDTKREKKQILAKK
jgi:hypothetical protein